MSSLKNGLAKKHIPHTSMGNISPKLEKIETFTNISVDDRLQNIDNSPRNAHFQKSGNFSAEI